MRHLLAVVLGSVFAAGCVGAVGGDDAPPGDDQPPPTGKMGETVYTRDVHPTLAKCSGGGCHNIDAVSGALGKFYAADAAVGYSKIVAAPTIVETFSSVAPILTKIAAGHQGVTYTPDEISKITNWLSVEATEHQGTNPTMPVVDPKQVLKTFSGCLTLTDFNTAQMAQAWGNLAASNNQRCANCHGQGAEGFIASSNADTFFKVISEQTAYMLKYFAVDTSSTPAKVVINTGSMANAGTTLAGHPRFNPTTNAGMTALGKFYDAGVAKLAAGTCGPPTLVD